MLIDMLKVYGFTQERLYYAPIHDYFMDNFYWTRLLEMIMACFDFGAPSTTSKWLSSVKANVDKLQHREIFAFCHTSAPVCQSQSASQSQQAVKHRVINVPCSSAGWESSHLSDNVCFSGRAQILRSEPVVTLHTVNTLLSRPYLNSDCRISQIAHKRPEICRASGK